MLLLNLPLLSPATSFGTESPVEVVALYRDKDRGPWWHPDGSTYTSSPFPLNRVPVLGPIGKRGSHLLVLVRVHSQTKPSVEFWSPMDTPAALTAGPNDRDVEPRDDESVADHTWWASGEIRLSGQGRTAPLRVRVSTDPWVTEGVATFKDGQTQINGTDFKPVFQTRKAVEFADGNKTESEFVWMNTTIPSSLKDASIRYFAHDRKGGLIETKDSWGHGGATQAQHAAILAPLAQIGSIELQIRPLNTFDFPSVATEPKAGR